MSQAKILTVIGTRPQLIKASLLSQAVRGEPKFRRRLVEVLVDTEQHYDERMAKRFFRELKIPRPDYALGVGSGSHAAQTAKMMERLERVMLKEKPSLVVVYGDTNSTLAGALAAVKLNLPVAHIEAGLRSYDLAMPEEVNRILTDRVSRLLFCPTSNAVENLKKEGVRAGVSIVGDLMVELCQNRLGKISERKILSRFRASPQAYFLATVHRAENTDDPKRLSRLLKALSRLDAPVLFPMHPRTRKRVREFHLEGLLKRSKTIQILPPLGYEESLCLQKNARKVLTDSGGVQKEAYILGTPCVTLRETTEWIETLRGGWNLLAGWDSNRMVALAKKPGRPTASRNGFGNGRPSLLILKGIAEFVG